MSDSESSYDRVIGYLSQTTPKLAAELSEIDLKETEISSPEIPNYAVIKQIGSGGFGDVWLVQNILDHQYYALKTLKEGREHELSAIREFKRRIPDHAHLVPIGHVGEADGTIYYLMPLADSALQGMSTIEDYEPMTLQEFVNRNGKMPADQVIHLGCDLLNALAAMHSSGGVHRDVKPANILLFDRVWRLSDPGLMALCCDDSPRAGTKSYRRSDSQENDIFADMYALGVTLEQIHDGIGVTPAGQRLHTAIARAKSEGRDKFQSTQQMLQFLSGQGRNSQRQQHLSWFSYALVAGLAFGAGWVLKPDAPNPETETEKAVAVATDGRMALPSDGYLNLDGGHAEVSSNPILNFHDSDFTLETSFTRRGKGLSTTEHIVSKEGLYFLSIKEGTLHFAIVGDENDNVGIWYDTNQQICNDVRYDVTLAYSHGNNAEVELNVLMHDEEGSRFVRTIQAREEGNQAGVTRRFVPKAINPTSDQVNNDLMFGSRKKVPDQNFVGEIHQVRIWGKAVDLEHLSKPFNPDEVGLVQAWEFSEERSGNESAGVNSAIGLSARLVGKAEIVPATDSRNDKDTP